MDTTPSAAARPPLFWIALLATPVALSANTTTTVVPDIAAGLDVSAAEATWAATAFGWGVVAGTPMATAVMRRGGTTGALAVNAALIAVGTLLVAAAPSLSVLLAGRAAQAAGGGGMVTAAIVLAASPARTGVVTASVGLVGAFGPLAGSLLAEASWRVPLGLSLLSLAAVPALLRYTSARTGTEAAQPTDTRGIALVLALASALVLLPRFPPHALAAATIAAALLALHVRRRPDGFVPTSLVRSHVFLTSAAAAAALSTSYFLILYTVPRTLEGEWGADLTGLAMLGGLATGSAASMLFSRYADRFGPRVSQAVILAAGALAASLALLAPGPFGSTAAVVCAVFAGTAALARYSARAGAAAEEPHRRSAMGLVTLAYQLGGAFGPALAALVVA